MPFIRITPQEDKAAGRAQGAKAFLTRSIEAWMKRGNTGWIPVRSSWIAAFKFNKDTRSFDVRTKTGRQGVYKNWGGIDYERFRQMLRVRSAGKWIWRNYPPRTGRGRRKR